VFVELNRRTSDGFTVALDWDRDTGQTQIVIHDARTATQTVFGVPAADAADAFRHPFRYAP
jgi:carotenoid cleavage dioxygenase-like enzyme